MESINRHLKVKLAFGAGGAALLLLIVLSVVSSPSYTPAELIARRRLETIGYIISQLQKGHVASGIVGTDLSAIIEAMDDKQKALMLPVKYRVIDDSIIQFFWNGINEVSRFDQHKADLIIQSNIPLLRSLCARSEWTMDMRLHEIRNVLSPILNMLDQDDAVFLVDLETQCWYLAEYKLPVPENH